MNLSEKAELALRLTREAKHLSYDTETSGLNYMRNYPIGYVFCADPKTSIYVPVRHGGGGNLPDPKVKPLSTATFEGQLIQHGFEAKLEQAFAERRQDNSKLTVGHNLKFDYQSSLTGGIEIGRNLFCTQNTQTLINEYTKGYSLDNVAKLYGVTAKLGDELYQHLANQFGGPATRKSMEHYWRTSGSDPIAVEYAEGDGVTTLEVFQKQREQVIKQELGVIVDVENQLIKTLAKMERRGVRIDREYLDWLIAHIEGIATDAKNQLPDDLNIRSGKQLQEYLGQFRSDWPTTEKGNPSFTEKWLKTFPEGQLIVNVRKWTNLSNSFAIPLRDEHTDPDGRVRPNINQNKSDDFGTISGRLSCSAPNLQQVPKHNEELAILFRKAFIADENCWFYEADYSQCEPRLFAHYSKEPALVKGYSEEPFRDVHTVVAELFNVDRGTTGKRMNMGMFTGMFPKSFAGHMGVSIKEATDLWNKWFAEFPEIKGFQDLAKQVILQRGYVKTLLGRRGRLDNKRFAYKATSKIIQGGNADIMKYKMLEIDKMIESENLNSFLQMTVHDSFIWQSPKGEVGDEEAAKIKKVMLDVQSEPFKLRVPFAVDMDRGENWAEASFGAENV